MSSKSLDFSKRTFFVLTGASRGIGATISIESARKLASGSTLLLTARNAEGLESTKKQILSINSDLTVLTHSIDLTNPSEDQLRQLITSSLPKNFHQAVIFHNVGSTGDVSKRAKEATNIAEWQENFATNVFSVVLLNNLFLSLTGKVKKYVINITSKAAIAPFVSFAFYCPNKAAREMYFKVLAEEEKDDENLVVLNYAPGPVDTDMLNSVGEKTLSEQFRDFIAEGKKTGVVLTTQQTVAKMLVILEKGEYTSGDHVDYFDV